MRQDFHVYVNGQDRRPVRRRRERTCTVGEFAQLSGAVGFYGTAPIVRNPRA